MKTNHVAFAALLGAGLLAGCSSEPVKTAAPSRPAWVLKGSGTFYADSSTVFYGVGVANPMPNISLQRKMAEQRAREEIATELKTSIKSMVKDYMDHHVDYFNAADTAGSDEFSSYVSKSVTEAELVDSRIVDFYEDDKTGALYALARMDTGSQLYTEYKDDLKKAIEQTEGAVVKGQAEAALKDLDKAIADQQSREKQVLGATEPAPPVETGTPEGAPGK